MNTTDPGKDLENDTEVEKVKPGCVATSAQVHEAPLGGTRFSSQCSPSSPSITRPPVAQGKQALGVGPSEQKLHC